MPTNYRCLLTLPGNPTSWRLLNLSGAVPIGDSMSFRMLRCRPTSALAGLAIVMSVAASCSTPDAEPQAEPASTVTTSEAPDTTTSTSEATTVATTERVAEPTVPSGSRLVVHGTGELSVLLPETWFASSAYAARLEGGWSLGAGPVIRAYDPGLNYIDKVLDPDASDRVEIWVPAIVDPTATTDPAAALDAEPRFVDCDEPIRESARFVDVEGVRDRYVGCGERQSERWQVAVHLPDGAVALVRMSVTGGEAAATEVLDVALGSLEFTPAPRVDPVDPSECVPSELAGVEPMRFSVTNASDEPAQLVVFDPTCASGEVHLVGRIGARENVVAEVLPGQLVAAADYDGSVRRTFVVGPANSFAIN